MTILTIELAKNLLWRFTSNSLGIGKNTENFDSRSLYHYWKF